MEPGWVAANWRPSTQRHQPGGDFAHLHDPSRHLAAGDVAPVDVGRAVAVEVDRCLHLPRLRVRPVACAANDVAVLHRPGGDFTGSGVAPQDVGRAVVIEAAGSPAAARQTNAAGFQQRTRSRCLGSSPVVPSPTPRVVSSPSPLYLVEAAAPGRAAETEPSGAGCCGDPTSAGADGGLGTTPQIARLSTADAQEVEEAFSSRVHAWRVFGRDATLGPCCQPV
jgi:hypothetical protein